MNRSLLALNVLVLAISVCVLFAIVPFGEQVNAVLVFQLVWFAPAILTLLAVAKSNRTLGGFALIGNAYWAVSGAVGVLSSIFGAAGALDAMDSMLVLSVCVIVWTTGVLNFKLIWTIFPPPRPQAQKDSNDPDGS
jgi:hypothetical protein